MTDDFRDGMPFLGGRLWIDLVNSRTPALGDLVATADGWRRWSAAAGAPLAGMPANLDELHALRGALASILDALAGAAELPQEAVAAVDRHLETMAARDRVGSAGAAISVWREPVRPPSAAGLVAADFADFAAAFEPARLRHCEGEGCSLAFYDTSRNGKRRWCSMEICGNRHKVRSHRAAQGRLAS